jgi:hypothetical protein
LPIVPFFPEMLQPKGAGNRRASRFVSGINAVVHIAVTFARAGWDSFGTVALMANESSLAVRVAIAIPFTQTQRKRIGRVLVPAYIIQRTFGCSR